MAKYLDFDGLSRYDGKIKTWVGTQIPTQPHLYIHKIVVYATNTNSDMTFDLIVINNSNTPINAINLLYNNRNNITSIFHDGDSTTKVDGVENCVIVSLYVYNNSIEVYGFNNGNYYGDEISTNNTLNLTDTIITVF